MLRQIGRAVQPLKVLLFNSKPYDRETFQAANAVFGHQLSFVKPHLDMDHVLLAQGHECVVPFVNDNVDAEVIEQLSILGVKLIATRSAGFDHIDLEAAHHFGIPVARVPKYSPNAVAEHAVALMLSLNRKTHRAYPRAREGDFSLTGLLGFDMVGKTAGVVGTGLIGQKVIKILNGFGCNVIAFDKYPSEEAKKLGATYVSLDELYKNSDIITLHCPLTPDSYHMIDNAAIEKMKNGVMIINTARGGLLRTEDVIDGIKSKKIGYLGTDVYESERGLFFEDNSDTIIQDETLQVLLSFPNVIMTAHQAFFTREALSTIAETTLSTISQFSETGAIPQDVKCPFTPK